MALVAAGLVLGCDPGYAYHARNESDRALIVDLRGDFQTDVHVPAGDEGVIIDGIGQPKGVVAHVLTEDCTELGAVELRGSVGVVTIGPDGAISGRPAELDDPNLPRGSLGEVDTCSGRVFGGDDAGSLDGAPSQRIGFISSGTLWDVWVVNGDGSGLINLTSNEPRQVQDAAWSPDGATVAVVLFRESSGTDLVVMDIAEGSLRLLRKDAYAPAWSPDGSEIAFRAGEIEDVGPIMAVRLEDGKERLITQRGGPPVWSPDGRWLTFELFDGILSSNVEVVEALGGVPRPLTRVGVSGLGPVWSPDSRHVAFTSYGPEERASIYLAALDGDGPKRLDVDLAVAADPSWSPKGDLLAFHGQRNAPELGVSDSLVYVARSDGLGLRELTSLEDEWSVDVAPAWSGDGSWLLYLRGSGLHEEHELRVIRADGTGQRSLAVGAEYAKWVGSKQ